MSRADNDWDSGGSGVQQDDERDSGWNTTSTESSVFVDYPILSGVGAAVVVVFVMVQLAKAGGPTGPEPMYVFGALPPLPAIVGGFITGYLAYRSRGLGGMPSSKAGRYTGGIVGFVAPLVMFTVVGVGELSFVMVGSVRGILNLLVWVVIGLVLGDLSGRVGGIMAK